MCCHYTPGVEPDDEGSWCNGSLFSQFKAGTDSGGSSSNSNSPTGSSSTYMNSKDATNFTNFSTADADDVAPAGANVNTDTLLPPPAGVMHAAAPDATGTTINDASADVGDGDVPGLDADATAQPPLLPPPPAKAEKAVQVLVAFSDAVQAVRTGLASSGTVSPPLHPLLILLLILNANTRRTTRSLQLVGFNHFDASLALMQSYTGITHLRVRVRVNAVIHGHYATPFAFLQTFSVVASCH
jgi:hypothetical protein